MRKKDEPLVSGILDEIKSPEDIKKLNYKEMNKLASEIRSFLIDKVSNTGGHLASNLGVVELTLALHRIFSTPRDKIVWDVGHQSYVHKIITGRKDEFDTLRQFGGISGFPKTNESSHDCFNTGHSSTSISAALGLAKARDILKEDYSVLAVIGDGALTGGMSFEALNDAGRSTNTNLIVILNDNEMSISRNVGGLSKYLSKIRTQPIYSKFKEDVDNILNKIPGIGKRAAYALSKAKGSIKYILTSGIIFEELGFKYLGPVDGHNIFELCKILEMAKKLKGPIFIHICTQKGKGYAYAEEKPQKFHGISPFEIETGEVKVNNGPGYSDVFGKELVKLARKDDKIVAITAAMPHGTGLIDFAHNFRDRFFDVGIAEQHGVTFAAGLAINGLKPVVAVYSSFLQRAYDQILHDVALQNLHVVFAIDRAGIVGEDGETHQGIYDLSYLGHMPNMTIMSPASYSEFSAMLKYALMVHKGPVAIRYPRGAGPEGSEIIEAVMLGKSLRIREGRDISIIAVGNMVEYAIKVSDTLSSRGFSVDLINARFIKPIDKNMIIDTAMKTGKILTLEDNVLQGGFGSRVNELLNNNQIRISLKTMGFPDEPATHGSRNQLFKKYGLDTETIAEEAMKLIRKK